MLAFVAAPGLREAVEHARQAAGGVSNRHAATPSTLCPAELRWPDWLLASLLAVASVAYLASLPLNVLTPPDEAHVLHQAKRLANGEVLYRDLFDLATPLWTYLMAGLFSLFGTTLATARLTIAVVHGATLLVMFLLCRRLGVRRELATIAAVAALALCQPVYPVANRHWLVTLFSLLLLFCCLQARRGVWSSLASGILVGLLIATHQQRGVVMGAAIAAWMVAQSLLERWYGGARGAPLRASLAAFAAAVAAVVGSILALVAWKAGIQAVWYALVVHPLTHYHGVLGARWAAAGARVAQTTFPLLLKYLPAVLVPLVARFVLLCWRSSRLPEARRLLTLSVFCSFAVLSIFYYPDLAHVAFIAPILFVALAETAEWAWRTLPTRWGEVAARVAVALFLAVSANRLTGRWQQQHSFFRNPRMTAFGRIDFSPGAAEQYDKWDRLLAGVSPRVVYVHPISSFLYLILGAHNPTRFEFLHAGSYNTAEQTQEVLAALQPERGVYVIFLLGRLLQRSDPIVRFVESHYEPVEGVAGVWRPKRTGAAGAPPSPN